MEAAQNQEELEIAAALEQTMDAASPDAALYSDVFDRLDLAEEAGATAEDILHVMLLLVADRAQCYGATPEPILTALAKYLARSEYVDKTRRWGYTRAEG